MGDRMKPSLHELISQAIFEAPNSNWEECQKTAEQIIKIVRDYHLVEDKKDYPFGWDGL